MTGPTAAPAHFPYAHRTVREVDIDEAAAAKRELQREKRWQWLADWRARQ